MLVAFTFRAKAGKEDEFREILDDPEAGRRVAAAMGATRNILFLAEGRMVRVMEFPDGAKPPSLLEIARKDAAVMGFLRQIGQIVEDGFDIDRPETLEAFNKRTFVPLAYDVRV
jgi:hypothetical protein